MISDVGAPISIQLVIRAGHSELEDSNGSSFGK